MGNVSFATRAIGDEFLEGEGMLLVLGDRGLDDVEPPMYDWGRELVCNGEGVIWRPGVGAGRWSVRPR
jgi:hypothetical protein